MRIPIKSARQFSKEFGLSHVIIWALEDGDNKTQHVVTYGKTVEQCGQAADFGNKLKDALGWPESLHSQPTRVKNLQKENEELKNQVRCLERSLSNEDGIHPTQR